MIEQKDSQPINIPFGEIGYITYKRTYARRLNDSDPDSKTEEFWQTVEREISAYDRQLKLSFTEEEKNRYRDLRHNLKISPAGRFMWQLGTKTVDKLGLPSLQNCAFVVVDDPIRPFTWAFEMLMLGSGVGFNIQREHVYQIPKVKKKIKIQRIDSDDADFIIPDTREGWVKLLGKVLKAHFYSGKGFTYSAKLIRSKGALIKGFGGVASGPEELCQGMSDISKILNARSGSKLRPIDCLDIMNIIGSIVVSGNVRRSAQIAIGDPDDVDFLKAKRWDLGSIPNWRAMSNNSVAASSTTKLIKEFWDTYEQGEPYGIVNLELSRVIGRTGDTNYPDHGVHGFNPCVTGETEVLTPEGYQRIDSLVGRKIDIWNGFEWSSVEPKITGHNQHIIKVTLSDGRELTSTDYHKWYLAQGHTGGKKQVTTAELKIGDKIIKYNFPILLNDEPNIESKRAYTQGFISAEGMNDYNHFWLYEPKYICKDRLDVRLEGNEHFNSNGIGRKSIYYNGTYEDKSFIPFDWRLESKLQWLAGLFDGDGTELKEGGLQLCSTDRQFLTDLQKFLSILSVNSKVVAANDEGMKNMPDGKGGYKEYLCQKSYRICIGATQMQDLKELGLNCARLSFNKEPQRDASQFTRVVKIEDMGYADEVYCFNEPKRHYGVFNGILTGQCAEQPLENYETCCLAEIYLPNISSYKEMLDACIYTYRVCKHSLRLSCSLEETESIVHKNMRMGIGVTGILQSSSEQKDWLSDAYEFLRLYDSEYSKKMGWPTSIKLTTVKPSGTLSLLPGLTPGAHPSPAGPYYIRRIRIASGSPLLDVCRRHGYLIEPQKNFDGTDDKNTMVVSFPCKVGEDVPVADKYSWRDQLDLVRWLQANWSDNAVSCTIYYRKEELEDIKQYLSEHLTNEIKSVSFLLKSDHGFVQAPYETISKELYESMVVKTLPITSVEVKESDYQVVECEGGACPIK